MPKRQVAETVHEHVRRRGWDDERIAVAKLSPGLVMHRTRPQRED